MLRYVVLGVLLAWPAGADNDRFDPTRSAVDQLVALAEALGVAEADITMAVWNGRIVPHLKDQMDVLQELDGQDCIDRVRAVLADKWTTATRLFQFDCSADATALGSPGHIAWNARFGAVSEEMAFQFARRNYVAITGDFNEPSWVENDVSYAEVADNFIVEEMVRDIRQTVSVPNFFTWTNTADWDLNFRGRYDEMRADYVENLDPTISVELGFLSSIETTDVFNAIWIPSVFRLLHDGEFDVLDWVWRARKADERGKRSTGWQSAVRKIPKGAGFTNSIALWGLARQDAIGTCGDPTRSLIYTETETTRNYSTGEADSRTTDQETVDVLSRFVPMIVVSAEVFRDNRKPALDLAKTIGCDSALRARLEANMAAYFAGEPPVYPPTR
ncbi:hypothetical protein N9L47_00235 [Rhodobacteraceae bacterium]|nr:hypothetical protein [Paracoccaceae bacterium]